MKECGRTNFNQANSLTAYNLFAVHSNNQSLFNAIKSSFEVLLLQIEQSALRPDFLSRLTASYHCFNLFSLRLNLGTHLFDGVGSLFPLGLSLDLVIFWFAKKIINVNVEKVGVLI